MVVVAVAVAVAVAVVVAVGVAVVVAVGVVVGVAVVVVVAVGVVVAVVVVVAVAVVVGVAVVVVVAVAVVVGVAVAVGVSTTATRVTIGGSEAAAACGIDPFRSRVQLWLEKTGRVEAVHENEAMFWGKALEPVITAEVERRGYQVMPAPYEGWQKGFMHGHPDGFVSVPAGHDEYGDLVSRGLLEIKTASAYNAKAWADEQVPPAYIVQVQHYLDLTGLQWALVAALIGGQRLELRRVERDQASIALIRRLESEFLGFVTRDEAPPPDGSDSSDAMLKLLYPEATGGTVRFTSDDMARVAELKKLKRAGKRTEAQIAELEQLLKDRLGTAAAGTFEGEVVCRWSNVTARRFAQSEFKMLEPELYEQHKRETTYRRFTLA